MLRRPGANRRGIRGFGGAVPAVAPWSPIDSEPIGFWHADFGVVRVALEVTDWENRFGALPDLTQATGTKRVDYVASLAALNGKAALHGDSADVMGTGATAAWEMLADGDDFTIVTLGTQDASAQDTAVATQDTAGIGYFRHRQRVGGASSFVVEDLSSVTVTDSSAAMTQSQGHVLASVYTGAVSPSLDSLESWLDGVSTGGPTTGDQDRIHHNGTEEFLAFAERAAGTNGIDGHLRMIIMWNRLLTAETDALLTTYINNDQASTLPGITQ